MQSTRLHLERVSLRALERLIEMARAAARSRSNIYLCDEERQAMRDVIEHLLRPAAQQVRNLAAVGGSRVEPSPAELVRLAAEAEKDGAE